MRVVVPMIFVATVLSVLASCAPTGLDAPEGPVVARFDGGAITADELDAHILSLPPAERPRPGEDLDAWYTERIRELVVDRRLLADASDSAIADGEEFRRLAEEARQQIEFRLCLTELRGEPETITEDDLRAAYESFADQMIAPERRNVYQIFLRRAPGARERIEELRDRVLAGEGFSRLAAEHSESETRHRDGKLGWIVPGALPAGFEQVVFSLEAGVPGEPVETRDGFHLFYVEQVLPPHTATFDEVRPRLREIVLRERTGEILAEIDAEIDPPPGSLILDRQELVEKIQAGDQDASVLRLGDLSWTLADLGQRVRAATTREPAPGGNTVETAWQILHQVRLREEISLFCREEGRLSDDDLEQRFDAWRDSALVDLERHRRLIELATEDEDRLRLFYDSNQGEFSKPPTWTLRLLHYPLTEEADRAVAVMNRLERAAAEGTVGLEALQAELGGEIRSLEPWTLREIRQVQPKLPALVAPLEVGGLSPPYRTEGGLEIAQVIGRSPAEPLPFDEARERVAERYVAQYTADLYDRLSERLLRDIELEIDPDALAELRSRSLPRPDVTVEELEALLDQV